MQKNIQKILLSALFLSTIALPSFAEDENPGELSTLSLEELLELEVITASKKSENLSDAPGVVTIITSKEIEMFGANNLAEILERVPGLYPLGSFLNPQSVLSVRGDLSLHYGVHTLILINGRPTRETFFGGLDSPVLLGFPLNTIERLEVVRGPGSVLYGSNAYSGVINIITKKPEKNNAKISGGYGSFNTSKISGTGAYSDDGVNLIAGVKFLRNSGWPFKAKDEQGKDISTSYDQHNIGSLISLNYKKFSFNTFISNSEEASLGVIPLVSYPPPGQTRQLRNRNTQASRVFMDASYNDTFFENLNTTFSATYNNTGLRYAVPAGDTIGHTNDLLLELTGDYIFNENLDWLIGGTTYFLTGNAEVGDDVGRGTPDYFDTWFSGYSQLNYRPFSFLKLIAGGQVNKTTQANIDFVPRLGIIGNFTPELGAKLLYGQAFRAPYQAETNFTDAPILTGNKNLLPEKITTLDAQLFYNSEYYQFAATYYNSFQNQLITRSVPEQNQKDFQFTYTNKGELVTQGVEVEGKLIPVKNLFILGSFSYQGNILNNTTVDATLAPKMMGKFGVGYSSDLGFSVGLFNSYFSAAGDNIILNPSRKEINPAADAFNNLTANVSLNIPKLFNLEMKESVILNIYGVNLLNAKINYPEFIRKNINTIPGRPGVSVFTDLSFGF